MQRLERYATYVLAMLSGVAGWAMLTREPKPPESPAQRAQEWVWRDPPPEPCVDELTTMVSCDVQHVRCKHPDHILDLTTFDERATAICRCRRHDSVSPDVDTNMSTVYE